MTGQKGKADKAEEKVNSTNQRKLINSKLEKARMQREERICTDAFVNILVPFTFVGLVANFIPYLLIIVPIMEDDLCWFYYLTRSPYQMGFIPAWLFYGSRVVKYIINASELIILIVFATKINQLNLNTQKNIIKEAKRMIFAWCFFESLVHI